MPGHQTGAETPMARLARLEEAGAGVYGGVVWHLARVAEASRAHTEGEGHAEAFARRNSS